MLNACTKETETLQSPALANKNVALQIKEYYPPEEVDVTKKVVGFLNHTKTFNPEASFKTAFKDMEVNEAMFTLEAAANYLVSENLQYYSDPEQEVLEFAFTFEVSKTDKEAIISGADLTRQFERLFIDIDAKAKSKNKLPKLVDFIFEESSNSKAIFKIVVVLADNKPIIGLEKIPVPGGFGQCNKMQQVFVTPCYDNVSNPLNTFQIDAYETISILSTNVKILCMEPRMAAHWPNKYYPINVGILYTQSYCTAWDVTHPDFETYCSNVIPGKACHGEPAVTVFDRLYGPRTDGSYNVFDVINNHLCEGNRKYLLDFTQNPAISNNSCGGTTRDFLAIQDVYAANRALKPTGQIGGDIGRIGGN